MNFDFSDAYQAKEKSPSLSAGIKDATFMGVEYSAFTSQKGDNFKVLALKLDIDGFGPYTYNVFEPKSNERKEGQYGIQPSQVDHFKIAVMEILEAVAPDIVNELNNGTKTITGDFETIVKAVSEWTAPFVGKVKTQVKIIPQGNGYNSIPGFPARITKNGDLGIATRFIGKDLVLTSSEQKRINAAATAAPTNMSTVQDTTAMLDAMKTDMKSDNTLSDLPF